MDPGLSFDELLAQLKSGDQGAAAEIFERYAARLIALARGRLQTRLRSKVDAEDIVQSVFKSFFFAQGRDKFGFDEWGDLWGLLVTMTVRKCGRRAKEFLAARRDVRREGRRRLGADEDLGDFDVADPQPTADEAAVLTELIEKLMCELDSREQQVFTLRLQGYTVAEIAKQIDRTERTVQRILERIEDRLQRER